MKNKYFDTHFCLVSTQHRCRQNTCARSNAIVWWNVQWRVSHTQKDENASLNCTHDNLDTTNVTNDSRGSHFVTDRNAHTICHISQCRQVRDRIKQIWTRKQPSTCRCFSHVQTRRSKLMHDRSWCTIVCRDISFRLFISDISLETNRKCTCRNVSRNYLACVACHELFSVMYLTSSISIASNTNKRHNRNRLYFAKHDPISCKRFGKLFCLILLNKNETRQTCTCLMSQNCFNGVQFVWFFEILVQELVKYLLANIGVDSSVGSTPNRVLFDWY